MKLSLRLSLSVLHFLILGAIFVPPDFSSSYSASRLIINWLVRLLVAIGFCISGLLLSHVLKSSQAESYRVIERARPDSDPDFGDEGAQALEHSQPRKAWSGLWLPRNLIRIAYGVALLSTVFHSAIFCEIGFVAAVIFLWMPNPWQAAADQPEIYEIVPHRISQ